MIKFIDKMIEKYVTDIRLSKWHSIKYGVVVAFLIFATSYTYSSMFENKTQIDNLIISGGTAVGIGIIWCLMSIMMVKQKDKRDAQFAEEERKKIEERRERASNKINNKKRKKYRRKEENK